MSILRYLAGAIRRHAFRHDEYTNQIYVAGIPLWLLAFPLAFVAMVVLLW